MPKIRIDSISIKNYRSFGQESQTFKFPDKDYKKPVAIVGYNNSGKTNLMNAIKYGLYESVREDTFELKDFHNCLWENPPAFILSFSADIVDRDLRQNVCYNNDSRVLADSKSEKITECIDACDCYSDVSKKRNKKWVIKQKAPIFYINFHKIKDEISIKKGSWGNLKSFLAKHIKKIVDADDEMKSRKKIFEEETKAATEHVLSESSLSDFVKAIKENYTTNLRDNNCEVDFGLPDYEDIFLQMIFKIGLYGEKENLVPIDHFGDGYISMFVMAVIKAIAESKTDDRCLFLFEEPESFLHENHQEYFYKTVLCNLSENGHQVIYTTHSDRMVDAFDTRGLIRIEFDERKKQTVKKYNDVVEAVAINPEEVPSLEIVGLSDFNSFIKSVEPNFNKILFSKKVVLVEGPNDLMVYKEVVKRKVQASIEGRSDIKDKEKYAETYLNFHNIAILPHHGKATAFFIAKLCDHIDLDYYMINDWDMDDSFIDGLQGFTTEGNMKSSEKYTNASPNDKSKITTNWKLLRMAKGNQIHFNVPKLEGVIDYSSDNKSSEGIWKRLQDMEPSDFDSNLFPESLEDFLEIGKLREEGNTAENRQTPVLAHSAIDNLPF